MAKKGPEQADNKRANGQFAPGNKLGPRFKPGESGNPNGRPKRTKISEALIAKLAETPEELKGKTVAEGISDLLIAMAAQKNIHAIREILDRTEGRPRQQLDIELTQKDWREQARELGLSEADVISEAKRIIESVDAACGAESDQQEAGG